MEMKTCARCGLLKSVESFYLRSASKPHLRYSYCKPCAREKSLARYNAHSDDPSYQRQAYDRLLQQRISGYTPGQREQMFSEQGGRCAVCGKAEEDNCGKRLSIDHDHETGQVRGLLCSNCNRGLGLLGDNLNALLRAVMYLQDNHG